MPEFRKWTPTPPAKDFGIRMPVFEPRPPATYQQLPLLLPPPKPPRVTPPKAGTVYVMNQLPSLAPLRVKIGWSINLESRLATHRGTCPDLAVLWTGDCCTQRAEGRCLMFAASVAVNRVGTEVFEFASDRDLFAALHVFQLIVDEMNEAAQDPSCAMPDGSLDSYHPHGS
jgi:hypothetical protein